MKTPLIPFQVHYGTKLGFGLATIKALNKDDLIDNRLNKKQKQFWVSISNTITDEEFLRPIE